jgi:nucleotide-binding universal stress UspA family protein
METIVIGYDESEVAKRALDRAAELAKAFQSQLIVTSVAPVVSDVGRSAGPTDSTDPPSAHVEQLRHARSYLEEQGVKADYVAAVGHRAETIAQIAKERDADLVIVGTHEPGVFRTLLGQSVSGAVVHKVHCDVLLVH